MKLTENQIEQFTLGLFASLGYQYIKGIELAPNREHQESDPWSLGPEVPLPLGEGFRERAQLKVLTEGMLNR